MSDIFVSYARSTEPQAHAIAEALRALGYKVWRDDELPAHRSYSEVIEERLRSAKAVVVVWSADAVRSQWVRAEADVARELGTLVQISVDGAKPPIPFNQIQCADLDGWSGDTGSPGWQKVAESVASLVGEMAAPAQVDAPAAPAKRIAVCVLPFLNMSGDSEQEYFSDGISEDIITDLSKVSALSVVARNTAFTYKGKVVDVKGVARELGVTHVLEGSVRKAGGRVRINAQLIDGAAGDHVWADRYDRDLDDIFAIQDEISKAIVGALQLKLLPKEKKAIEHRGTSSPEAYNLYLMARQHWISGNDGEARRDEAIVRICRQVVTIDPDYGKAWALMALAQSELRFRHDRFDEDALDAAERALSLDPTLAEAYCVKARYLADQDGKPDEAMRQIGAAIALAPGSWEVNKEAARLLLNRGDVNGAIPFFEKAASLMDSDYHACGMLVSCYGATGEHDAQRRLAMMTLARVEKALAQDPTNGGAIAIGVVALAALGEAERCKQWIQRAMLIAPENLTMRYNLVCALTASLNDHDAALDLLEGFIEEVNGMLVARIQVDPDFDGLRGNPRFEAMLATAKDRVAAIGGKRLTADMPHAS